MLNRLNLKSVVDLILSLRSIRSAVIVGSLMALFFLRQAVPVTANGFVLLLQAQIILLLSIVLNVASWCWTDMVGAYQLSPRYRTVLPHGNAFHRAVHALLEEAVCGSRLTGFLAVFIPWTLVVGLPALTAWLFDFASLKLLIVFSVIAWALASLVNEAVCDALGWEHEKELLLFWTVNLRENDRHNG